ncbi:mitochondrial fission factor homolog A-like isoform X2 [Genypterus blacodes]|uniref:mitochondrial fission factor homolog A-like isoform X2 n=1 Tax=Genypterus blacodes TaxID=154954 RepID=UPI003F7728D1
MLTSFGLHPREMSQVPGRDAAFMEVINQKMLVPERLSVGSGQQWGGEEMGEARGRTKELPPAYSMHIPDRLTYTEAPDMSPKPLFTETKQAVSGLEEPRWGSSSTTREETNVYRESFQSPIKRSYSDQSFGTTSPATPNQLSQAAALPRQLSASFNYKEKTAQPSATEVPADHNRRRPVENWSLEEEGGAAVEFIVLRRQVVKMSRRLAALERHNTERRNSELVLFSLLFSACLLNTWLWIRR